MLSAFRHIVVVDFEFEFGGHASFDDAARSGERPRPVCMVAKELHSGQEWCVWRDEFGPAPPFPIGPDSLLIAYYASAELGCFRALGWPKPANILDLFVEFRDRTNGLTTPAGAGLVGALTYFGIDAIGATEKDEMRAIILRGGPWSSSERESILDYCASDIAALERLLPGDAAADRSAARLAPWTLHGCGCGPGIRRHTDRHGNAVAAPGELGPHQG
jgi:DNA polymerase I